MAEHAGQQPGDGVDDDAGAQLTAGKDKISDGELAVAQQLRDAFVHALVASTDEDDALESGEAARFLLVEAAPSG